MAWKNNYLIHMVKCYFFTKLVYSSVFGFVSFCETDISNNSWKLSYLLWDLHHKDYFFECTRSFLVGCHRRFTKYFILLIKRSYWCITILYCLGCFCRVPVGWMRAPHDRVFRKCFFAGERDISSTTASVWNITISLTSYRLIRA